MSTYSHKKFSIARLLSMALRGLINLISVWPLALLALWYFAPTTLHLRWSYEYQDIGETRVYYRCTYLGPHGFTSYMNSDICPFLLMGSY